MKYLELTKCQKYVLKKVMQYHVALKAFIFEYIGEGDIVHVHT